MAEAKKSSQVVKIRVGESDYQANGTKILFPGFLRVYVEGKDDPNAALDDKEVILPDLEKGDLLSKGSLKPSEILPLTLNTSSSPIPICPLELKYKYPVPGS